MHLAMIPGNLNPTAKLILSKEASRCNIPMLPIVDPA